MQTPNPQTDTLDALIIGAGFTGGSVLAITSLVALLSMILSAMIADRVLDGDKAAATNRQAFAAAAE